MRTNYVLIDYENIQPDAVVELDREQIRVLVFLGPKQGSVRADLVKALQPLGPRAKWIQISASGKNALDFHIAYFMGEIASKDPEAYLHIISKDAGYDPLLQYLKRERRILAGRYQSLSEIPLLRANSALSLKERVALVVQHFQRPKATKPATRKTLSNTVANIFQKSLSESELSGLIDELIRLEHIKVNGTKIKYNWPEAAAKESAAS